MSDCGDAHCITCSDEATPMWVVAVAEGIATCADEEGAHSEVMTDLVGPVQAGEVLLVHAGAALGRLE